MQQRFSKMSKTFWWGVIDEWLAYDIYYHERFPELFEDMAKPADKYGNYPVMKVRKVMWILRMKPLPKEWWEES